MKRAASLAFAGILAASLAYPMAYYVLEVRGGSRIYALDRPVRKGRVVLFRRHPDGDYVSLPAEEVVKISTSEEPPKPDTPDPGQAVFVGPALEGPGFEVPREPAQVAPPVGYFDSGYGYYGWSWGGGYVRPPRPPLPAPPSRIGSNGFPILAPAGSPGSTPPPIGSNGFPVLSPPPSVPQPH